MDRPIGVVTEFGTPTGCWFWCEGHRTASTLQVRVAKFFAGRVLAFGNEGV